MGGARAFNTVYAVFAQKEMLYSDGISKHDAYVVGRATLKVAQVLSAQPNLAQLARYA